MERRSRTAVRTVPAVLLAVTMVALGVLLGPASGLVAPAMAQQGRPQQPPADYVLNPGDVVEISVLGEADLSRTVAIRPDGKINLPMIGDVLAGGQTPRQLAEQITTALKTYLRNPQVSVSVKEFRVERAFVYVVGQFQRPGPIEIQKGWTVMEVMAVAGGFTPRAALRRASIIRRGTGESIPLDLDKLITAGDRSANMPVEPGDIIMLPAFQNRILVLGSVNAPGAYDIDEGGRVLEAIALAKGTAERARPDSIGVIRNTIAGKPTVTTVDMNKMVAGDASQNIVLQNADVVYVPGGRVFWTDVLSWLGSLNIIRLITGF